MEDNIFIPLSLYPELTKKEIKQIYRERQIDALYSGREKGFYLREL